jgi:hypothetical protein
MPKNQLLRAPDLRTWLKTENVSCDPTSILSQNRVLGWHAACKDVCGVWLPGGCSSRGQEVIKALESIPYDLVLMEYQLPEMYGFEATRAIRNLRMDIPIIPIIAMTANAIKGGRELCFESGMNDYLSKPVGSAVFGRCRGSVAEGGFHLNFAHCVQGYTPCDYRRGSLWRSGEKSNVRLFFGPICAGFN